MSGNYSSLRIDRRGHVAEVVLNRPERLNRMPPAFFMDLLAAFEEIDRDDQIRVALIWAEGRLFSAGLDLNEAAFLFGDGGAGPDGDRATSEASRNFSVYRTIRDWQRGFSTIEQCPKPVIAAVHGKCVGGGVDLITACDIRYCTADASFSIAETKIAIVADVGTLQRITPIVGKGMAREMALTGAFVGAERALRAGLVNEVYEDKDALLAAARATADEIAANPPLAVQGTKAVLNYSDEHSVEESLDYVAKWNAAFFRSNDVTEAVTAFLEKRKPEFKGN